MKILRIAVLAAAGLVSSQAAFAGQAEYAEMVAAHARANGVPEALVHRVIMRESRYQPGLVGHGGTIGLMQIKLATARGLGYTGDASGLRDPNTNLTYAVKYLAGAYRAANGDHDRAVRYFAGGYYYIAKRQRQEAVQQASFEPQLEPNGNPQPMFGATPHRKLAQQIRNARAQVPGNMR
ncbi:transglycosylase SLT domain-containing protein [Bradyrhizobium sp. GCM10027634]|uniref:lytic transglycosylase domain-containing protein n=1 Tax=unclassified Bradyrhizobium TaxID=2631580 RepID=UPI00188A9EEB|nr:MULTISPECIES: lytic transglycosylase domain-containing protein [unclassified Bradyrhizobium]MDN4999594.1 lytic transglycosylase domain-containing protein [Bradyrhizobium sp. WYCCWR 12677]QOZ43485.1 lytic transglycosylase domain-containing protein [Bradyrhizobium sp. CCBAU 53340]